MDYKVAAYITAYEEPEAVKSCITAIKRQSYPVQEIFIIDNSAVPSVSTQESSDLVVNFHPENIGVAGGLKLGIAWAIKQEYDFLWALDQDSEPNPDLLEKLLKKYQELSYQEFSVGIVAPLVFEINTQQEFPGSLFDRYKLVPFPNPKEQSEYYQCDAVITSGALISTSVAKLVEPPNEGLFLDAIDYSYCMNFRKKGYQIIVVRDAILKHRIGNYCKVKIRSRKGQEEIFTFVCSPSRYYYACRNHTYLETRLAEKRMLHRAVIYRTIFMLRFLKNILRYEPDFRAVKMFACILGTVDGFRGRLGKTW
ncbi:glycosyltransferase family 2 protein [Coleofasciculus sp. FACHB-501]|uniref:glycosyltransferase family 2 protein n=1 Tax=Cyanophyceae TaxID=3028117 RepID=UPI00168758A0|nr:glycosyltransferase family 2 protein [Coleofasciculus sp. FACHB-501]MBD1837184.1 glycosyltransferase family 2 protein [Coleofasciculus sp. FACHB-501]